LKNSNDWMANRTDIRQQVDLLPPVARNLYQSDRLEKVKHMMSVQKTKIRK